LSQTADILIFIDIELDMAYWYRRTQGLRKFCSWHDTHGCSTLPLGYGFV